MKYFSRVNDNFEKNGTNLKTPVKRTKTKRTNENLQKIQDKLEKKVQFSVRNAAPKLSLSTSTVWRLLRYDSKAKFYRPSTVQPLTEAHMEQRRKFCSWLLEHPADFTKNVVWADEKIFILNQRPNRKNDGLWIETDRLESLIDCMKCYAARYDSSVASNECQPTEDTFSISFSNSF